MMHSDRSVYWLSAATGLFGIIGFPLSFLVAWSGDVFLGLAVFFAAAICIAIGATVGSAFKIVNGSEGGTA